MRIETKLNGCYLPRMKSESASFKLLENFLNLVVFQIFIQTAQQFLELVKVCHVQICGASAKNKKPDKTLLQFFGSVSGAKGAVHACSNVKIHFIRVLQKKIVTILE